MLYITQFVKRSCQLPQYLLLTVLGGYLSITTLQQAMKIAQSKIISLVDLEFQ